MANFLGVFLLSCKKMQDKIVNLLSAFLAAAFVATIVFLISCKKAENKMANFLGVFLALVKKEMTNFLRAFSAPVALLAALINPLIRIFPSQKKAYFTTKK